MPEAENRPVLRITRAVLVVAFLIATLVAAQSGTPSGATSGCTGSDWVGACAAAPSNAGLAGEPAPGRVLADQTLRMVVRSTLAGNRARGRLTHRYGDEPRDLASATLARSDLGAAAPSGTMRRLTFRASGSVTLQPGAKVIADADAPLPVGPRWG